MPKQPSSSSSFLEDYPLDLTQVFHRLTANRRRPTAEKQSFDGGLRSTVTARKIDVIDKLRVKFQRYTLVRKLFKSHSLRKYLVEMQLQIPDRQMQVMAI